MGALGALGMAEQVSEGNLQLNSAIRWHLGSNHYPPVPVFMDAVALAAIEAGQDEDWDKLIKLPKGCTTHQLVHDNGAEQDSTCALEPAVTWSNGSTSVRAGDVIESFRLDSFIFSFNDPTVVCCGRDAADCDC